MIFICFDLDETIFSADYNIAALKEHGYMSTAQLLALDSTEYQTCINILNQDKTQHKLPGDKVQFYHIEKHLTLFDKASKATGRNFSLFFLTNGLYSRNSVNLVLRQAAAVKGISPPKQLFQLYNRNDLFGNSDGSQDPNKIAHEKVKLLIRHKATLVNKYGNRSEAHSFYFIDDNDTNRRFMEQRVGAITIDPKSEDYPQRLDELIQLANDEIQLAEALKQDDVI